MAISNVNASAMRSRNLLGGFAWTALTLLILSTTAGDAADDTTRMHMTGKELAARLAAGTAPAVIDTRSRWEFNRGHVPGAIHLPFWQSFSRAADLTLARDRPVVVYCEHGPRAVIARYALQRAGFRQVLYLDGHMSAWRRAGLPVDVPVR
jgi:rhodanese-related sulfurtransferase